jgi:tyrosyl-tRNA synthetase
LTKKEVLDNAKTYEKQIFKVLDKAKTKIVFNSEWLNKLGMEGLLDLTKHCTVNQLLARDDFKKRYSEGRSISLLEFIYPLLQGYDSVHLKADVELGGADQIFNLLVGRQLQQDFGQKPQVVITMPLLEGLDGTQKMSKSLNNYVGINEEPKEMFGKIMSISDELMYKYYELLTDEDLSKINPLHPLEAKKLLAGIITTQYHGTKSAQKAQESFSCTVQSRSFDKVEETLINWKGPVLLVEYLSSPNGAGLGSKSHIRRLIKEKAVEVDGQRVSYEKFALASGRFYNIRAGKKFFVRVKFNPA